MYLVVILTNNVSIERYHIDAQNANAQNTSREEVRGAQLKLGNSQCSPCTPRR